MVKFEFYYKKDFKNHVVLECIKDVGKLEYIHGCSGVGFAYINLGAWGWDFTLKQFGERKLIDRMTQCIVHEYVHAVITEKERKKKNIATETEERFVRIMAGQEEGKKMSDNKKKKKADAKRVAFRQEYEVDYLKKKTKEIIESIETDLKYCKKEKMQQSELVLIDGDKDKIINEKTILRILKGLLKLIEK